LWVGETNNVWAALEFTKANGTIQGFVANSHINGTFSHLNTYIPSSATSGSLGIGFNGIIGPGGEITLWFNAGSGWTKLASGAPNFTANPFFAIEGYDLNGTSLSFQVADVQIVPRPWPLVSTAPLNMLLLE